MVSTAAPSAIPSNTSRSTSTEPAEPNRPSELADIFEQIDAMPPPVPFTAPAVQPSSDDQARVVDRAIAHLAKLPAAIQGQQGSSATMRAARVVCWEYDLGAEIGYSILATHFNPRCEPPWTEGELRHKCNDAMKGGYGKARGCRLAESPPARTVTASARLARGIGAGMETGSPSVPTPVPDDIVNAIGCGPTEPPNEPPTTAEQPSDDADTPGDAADAPLIGVDDADPSRLAAKFVKQYRTSDGYTLAYWREDYYRFAAGASQRIGSQDQHAEIVGFTESEIHRIHADQVAKFESQRERGATVKPPKRRQVTTSLTANVSQCVRRRIILPSSRTPPFWIDDDGPPPSELIAMRNGIVHLPTLADGIGDPFTPSTPRYFCMNACDYDYMPTAPLPTRWLAFLQSLWPDDPDSIRCLQEWFGYLLTPDTSRQKILLVIGPPRAGKGTIGRVLRALVGENNVAAPKLSQFAERFGLQSMIGKSVAMVPDARLSGRADAVAVVETLLAISGEDPVDIDRKNRESISTKLGTRFVIFSNELPRLGDSSGAIMSRLIVLRLTKSFLGEEDERLAAKLMEELPGIFHWACDGWKRLRTAGKFTQPESATELIEEARDIASPVMRFVEERCRVNDDGSGYAEVKQIYAAWVEWCKKHGYQISSDGVFGRDLRSAFPRLSKGRERDGSSRRHYYFGIEMLSAVEAGDYGN